MTAGWERRLLYFLTLWGDKPTVTKFALFGQFLNLQLLKHIFCTRTVSCAVSCVLHNVIRVPAGIPARHNQTQQPHLVLALDGTALHYTALPFTAWHFTALHCTVLQCTVLYCAAIYCNLLQSTAKHCNAL